MCVNAVKFHQKKKNENLQKKQNSGEQGTNSGNHCIGCYGNLFWLGFD